MKKIIMSLGVIVFAGALIAGATGAFFNDTETSTGNVFTAGAIDLKVDSTQHYNNAVCVAGHWALEIGASATVPQYPVIGETCGGSWTATDLGASNKFFDFGDVKPGDEGENTISLHIDSNPAWACADVAVTSNSDQTCVGPENGAGAENGACVVEGDNGTHGDLAQNLWFVAWNDNASGDGATPGDNIHQAGEQLFFTPGPASNVFHGGTLTLADGGTGAPLPGGSDSFIGLAWCAGTMTATTGGGAPTCNGATMGNNAQTDSMTADITFRIEQARNNSAFRCTSEAVLPVAVNADNLALTASSPTGWFFYNDQTDTIQSNGAGHQFVAGPAIAPAGTGSVNLTKTTNDKYGIATNQFGGTQLSDLTALKFSTYRTTGTSAQVPSLGFDIDSDTSDADVSYQGRLTYEPYFTHTVNTGVWEEWNTQDDFGTGNWWFSHANLSGGAPNLCTQANPCTWTELNTAYPNLTISGRTILRTNGADNEVFNGNVDKLVMGNTTYDFGN